MAIQHFNDAGLPKLDVIVSEITEYFTNLPTKYKHIAAEILTEKNFGKDIDVFKLTEEDMVVMALMQCIQSVPETSVKVNGIYVIGSQAEHLPDSYLAGDHDLDLKLRTDMSEIIQNPNVRNLSVLLLKYHMNDSYCITSQPKEGFIDIVHEDYIEPLRKPYLQIN